MNTSPWGWLGKVWKVIRWPVWVLLGLFVALCIYRTPAVLEQQKTEKVVAAIHAKRLTLDTVMGKNLPAEPEKAVNDATVEGIDANENGIRDDVELAIHRNYPNSARIRAAQLQYAMALQTELTEVFNEGTMKAVAEEGSRASSCIASTIPKINPLDSEENINKILGLIDERTEQVDSLVLNTDLRVAKRKEISEYLVSYGRPDGLVCDVDVP